MTDHFKIKGRALLANGYSIIPIRKGEKRPAIASWQRSQLGVGDLGRYPDHGVGVLCGQGAHPIVGVDIDISHPVIGPALIAWCQENLGAGGERVGAAPRILLVYRAAEAGWAKCNSVSFFDPTDPLKPNGKRNEQQIELLGNGQQFVAYHEHPDTLRDYEWVDMFGGIEHMAAATLPVVTSEQIDALLVEAMRLVRATPGVEITGTAEAPAFRTAGGSEADDLMSLTARVGTSLPEMASLMGFVKNEDSNYDMWLKVGMALHHEYADTEHEADALEMWKAYGRQSTKDDPGQYGYKWRSFGGMSGTPTTLRWLLKIAHQAKRDGEVVERRAVVDEIKALIKGADDSLKLGGEIATKIKGLLPDDSLMRTEILGAFQQQYRALAGTSMTITQARTLLLGPKMSKVQAKRPLTELGNADRMLDRFGTSLMYVPEVQQWYIYTGVYWRRTVDVEIEHLAKETIRSLNNEAADLDDDQRKEFYEFCAISQQAKMVRNMVALAVSDPRVCVPARELDKHSHLLGVANGVLNLLTGQLEPPDPEYRITMVAGCEAAMAAQAPLFEQTVKDVFSNDMDMVDYFYRVLGYTLMGNPKEDVMFIPFGNGANGKSTVFGIVRQVFGDYAKSAEAGSFVSDGKQGNAGGAREDLVRLRAARFVYVNEPDENGELREGAVKSMTGGDAITARGLYAKASVEIVPTWTVFMPTNHKPIVKGGDNGIWRRLVLMPFERNFESDPTLKKDPNRVEKLMAELPGVLALLVRGALAYQRDGLLPPGSVRAARDSYRSQMDLLAEWLEDCCEVETSAAAESNALWASWEAFAKSHGILNYVKSSIALGRRLEARFPSFKGNRGVRMRRGLRLKPFDAGLHGLNEAGEAGEDLFS